MPTQFKLRMSSRPQSGVACFPSVTAIPGPVDLAVIVVPAAQVQEVAQACGEKGVRALLVISSGFAEAGDEGRARQAALAELAPPRRGSLPPTRPTVGNAGGSRHFSARRQSGSPVIVCPRRARSS